MLLVENEKFAEWLDRNIDAAVFVNHGTPARKTRKAIPGAIAKVWRWYHTHMSKTSQFFNTSTHKREADRVEFRGWNIIETPARQYVTKSQLFYEIAQGLNKEIPQLSHKTQISTGGDYPHRLMGQYIPSQKSPMFGEVLGGVSIIDYETYEIEWNEFVFQVNFGMFYDRPDRYYLAVAYDALNDCLYVDYRDNN